MNVQIDEKTITLVDTPGFDDTNRSDSDILTAIATYLETKCVVTIISLVGMSTDLRDIKLSPESSFIWHYFPSPYNGQSHGRCQHEERFNVSETLRKFRS